MGIFKRIFKGKKREDPKQEPNLKEITHEIYKRNLELAVVNKTLSLLRKLYQISLQSLDPASLAEKMSETVRLDLNMEIVGIFTYDNVNDELKPFLFAKSNRIIQLLKKFGFLFKDIKIAKVADKPLLKQVVHDKNAGQTDDLNQIWTTGISAQQLVALSDEGHVKTILLYPLLAQGQVIGVLLLGLNRDYNTLSTYEQDSIKSLIDVVAVALDKAQLYEKLKVANEELRVLDKARAEFISIASHQLRTPPSTIKWYLAAAVAGDFGKISPKVLENLKKIENTNNGLISLIDDLLNVSRIERGKMEFIFQDTDMGKLVQAAVDQLVPQAITKKLKLKYKAPKKPLPTIVADYEKLKQVVNNLIDNAIKYTRKGSVSVSLTLDGDELSLMITDSGRGMSKAELGQIFEKFKRGKDSRHEAAGLGLGLYVAKVVVEHHHGKIWAESKGEDKGSTFHVTLPIHTDLTAEAVLDLTQELAGKK